MRYNAESEKMRRIAKERPPDFSRSLSQLLKTKHSLPLLILPDFRIGSYTTGNTIVSRIIVHKISNFRKSQENGVSSDFYNNSIETGDRKPKKVITAKVSPRSTFEQHQELVTQSFAKSSVERWLGAKGFEFVADTAIDPNGDAVVPIHEFLNPDKHLVTQGHQARANQSALLMFNEDGSAYQAILNEPYKGKPYKYRAPNKSKNASKGEGNRAFLPHIPKAVRRAIAERYEITDPEFLDTDKSFWEFVADHPEIPIIITEGVKKALSLLNQGYVAIAVYGYRCLHSPDLERFLPGRDVVVAMDSDDGAGKWYEINSGVLKDSKVLATKGVSSISIATWVGSKGIDDLFVERGSVAVDDAIANALTPAAFASFLKKFRKANRSELALKANSQAMSKWLRRATGFSATYEFDKQFVELEDIKAAVSEDTWLVAIKSGLGSGKTQVLAPLIEWLESTGKGRGVVMLGSRNTLLLQTAKRINAHHLHQHSAFNLIRDPDSRIAACVDSLTHFLDEHIDGKILLLDETINTLKHEITSSTCARNRPEILERFEQAIKRAAIVICLDGNMADWATDYIQTLRDDSKGVAKILNLRQSRSIPLEVLPSFGQSGLVAKIKEVLPLYKSQGRSIAIATDSQRLGEKLDIMFADLGYRIFRIDSKTTTTKAVKKYLENPDRNFDILIYTPSCESGLDIPLNGFAHTFAFFMGVVDTATQIQMLRRVREVDRIAVQCVPYSRLNRQRSPILEELQKELEDALLKDWDEQLKHLTKWLQSQKDSPHYPLFCEMLRGRDFERANTLDCFVQLAKSHGYSPEIIDIEDCKGTQETLKEASQQIKESEAIAIFKARDLTTSQALSIKASFTASLDDRYALQRWEIKDTLPGIEDTEFWSVEGIIELRDKWRDIPKLRLLWHSQNLEKSKVLSKVRWQNWIEQDRFIGDCLGTVYAKAKMINALGIIDIQKRFSANSPENPENQSLSANSPEIQAIAKIGTDKRPGLRSVLGVTKGRLEPMQWLKNLLGLVGLKTVMIGRKSGGVRSYQIAPFSPLEKTIFDCISTQLETQYQQALEPCQLIENIVPNLVPVGRDLPSPYQGAKPTAIEPPPPPETPKLIPLSNPQLGQKVALTRAGKTILGTLLSWQSEFCRVNFPDGNQIVSQFELQAIA